jgi:hypothetical protein
MAACQGATKRPRRTVAEMPKKPTTKGRRPRLRKQAAPKRHASFAPRGVDEDPPTGLADMPIEVLAAIMKHLPFSKAEAFRLSFKAASNPVCMIARKKRAVEVAREAFVRWFTIAGSSEDREHECIRFRPRCHDPPFQGVISCVLEISYRDLLAPIERFPGCDAMMLIRCTEVVWGRDPPSAPPPGLTKYLRNEIVMMMSSKMYPAFFVDGSSGEEPVFRFVVDRDIDDSFELERLLYDYEEDDSDDSGLTTSSDDEDDATAPY